MIGVDLSEDELNFIYFILDLANDHSFLEDPVESDKLQNLVDKLRNYLHG